MVTILLFIEASLVLLLSGTAAYLGRFLDLPGVIAALGVGYVSYLAGGRLFFLVLFAFLAVAGTATRYRYRQKYGEAGRAVRSWTNVVANGGVASAALLLGVNAGTYRPEFMAAFLGAISSAFADTMATEIGLLYNGSPRMITSLRRVAPGTPGGVTHYGFLGSLAAVAALWATLLIPSDLTGVRVDAVSALILLAATGFTGSLFDSVIGGLFQGRYRCTICRRVVEVKKHCGETSILVGGIPALNNDVVNVLATILGAAVGLVFALNGADVLT